MRERITAVETGDFRLEYFRTFRQDSEDAEGEFHGIYVAKLKDGRILEQADSGPITKDKMRACEIIAKLAENTVTPMVLYEILDEMEI